MAKTRRSLSSIAKGVKSSFVNALKFGSDRRREVLDDLHDNRDFEEELEAELGAAGELDEELDHEDEETIGRSPIDNPVPPMDDFTQTQTGMLELAKRAFELNKIEEMRTMFLLLINNYTKELNENPSNFREIQNKLDTKKEQLSEFDDAVTIIKAEEQINNINESTNRIIESLNEDFEKLIEYLDDLENNKFNLNVLIMNIENKLSAGLVTPTGYQVGTYLSNIALSKELNERYKDLTGYDYNSPIDVNYFSSNHIRKIYGEIESKIRVLQGKIEEEQEPTEVATLKGIIADLDNLIQYLPSLLKNPSDFAKIKSETDSVLDRAFGPRKDLSSVVPPKTVEPEPEKNPSKSNSLFVIMAEQHMKKIYEKIRQLSSEFKATDTELKELIANFNSEVNKVTSISEEEKNEIIGKIEDRYNQKLIQEFGPETYNFICSYSPELEEKMAKLNSCIYGTPSFENAYKELRDLISEMMRTGKSDNINVTLDEEKQSLQIDFPTDKVKTVKRQIVSDEILTKFNKTDEEENNREKEQETIQFTHELETIHTEYDKELERIIRELPAISNLSALDKKLSALLNDDKKYPHLTYKEKCNIQDEVEAKHSEYLNQKIGNAFVGFVYSVVLQKINEIDFKSIEKYEYGTLEFDLCYKELLNSVLKFKNDVLLDANAENFIANISFDEDSQRIRIDYKNETIKSFERQIVSDEILAKMREDKRQEAERLSRGEGAPVPPQPTPAQNPISSSGNDIIQDYINKVNEVNSLIELLNEINAKLEAQAILDFIDAKNVSTTIALENEAKALDEQLINLKLELSRDRIEIKKNHNIFVGSLPEVKAMPIQTINFSGELKDFVHQHDEMIVEAEKEILSLDNERKNNSHSAAEIAEINNKISTLVEFIDAQNSLIGRRLVSEAKNINIVEFLKNRQEAKKEMRDRLRQIKEEKIVEPVPPVGAPEPPAEPSVDDLENEYRYEANKIAFSLLEECVVESRESLTFKAPSSNYLSSNCNNLKLITLDSKYNSIEARKIRREILDNVDKYYAEIIRVENLKAIADFDSNLTSSIDSLSDEDLKSKDLKKIIEGKIAAIKAKSFNYNTIECAIDLDENSYVLKNSGQVYDFEKDMFTLGEWKMKMPNLMSNDMYNKYNQYKNNPHTNDDDKEFILSDEVKNVSLEALQDVGLFIIYNGRISIKDYENLEHITMYRYSITKEQFNAIMRSLEDNKVFIEEGNSLKATMDRDTFLNLISKLQEAKKNEQPSSPVEPPIEEPEIKISTRQLNFNPKKQKQFADREKDFIREGDNVTISIIKNGVKIKYSQELREKLSELNAKISLVNKKNYRVRSSEAIKETEETQNLGFKDERAIDPNDYRIEIRVPNHDKSSVLFEYDLENVEEEMRARSK